MPGKMARSDPRLSVRVTRGAGSGQHLASVLQEGRENANIDASLGFIWRISAKHLYHSIICIGALIARRDNDQWVVDVLGAPHVGERPALKRERKRAPTSRWARRHRRATPWLLSRCSARVFGAPGAKGEEGVG